jgi:hypothetical protein
MKSLGIKTRATQNNLLNPLIATTALVYGTSRDLAIAEVEQLYPTISMPVSIALFDLGSPIISNGTENGGD